MKTKAIQKIIDIQNGRWDRNAVKDIPNGSMAKRFWDDAMFSYGMEYGAIAILMELFNIQANEIKDQYN